MGDRGGASSYELVPLFQVRVTGVAFDELERLGSPASVALVRELGPAERALEDAARRALAVLRSDETTLDFALRQKLRNELGQRRQISADLPELGDYRAAYAAHAALMQRLDETLHRELAVARAALGESLPGIRRYAVFSSDTLNAGLETLSSRPPLAARTAADKDRERHFFLYLQRVCAKNDTLSEFGPAGWGRVAAGEGVHLPTTGSITQREVYLERWVATAVAKSITADEAARAELLPRRNPCVRIDGAHCTFDSGEVRTLTAAELALIQRCDGVTPAYAVAEPELLGALVTARVLTLALESPAMATYPLAVLRADVAQWREGAVKAGWLKTLDELLALPPAFARELDPGRRRQILDEARGILSALGTTRLTGQRTLYAATNPIGEDCLKSCDMVVSSAMAAEFATEAAPWLDLWRDTYAFATSRIADTLRELLKSVPQSSGRVSLAALLRYCEDRGQSLERLHSQTAEAALGEVKTAFTAMLGDRAGLREITLSAEDCQFVRRNFAFRRFAEFTWPSADLMIAATSPEASQRGEYTWVLAEIHPFVVPFTHCFYFSCPDPALFHDALLTAAGGQQTFMFAQNTTTHTFPHLCDVAPEAWAWLGAGRSGVRSIAPADAEVYVDAASADVRLRHWDTGADLGSMTRGHWRTVGFGLHPFIFSVEPHLPRLRLGKVIIQRESWWVRYEELGGGPFDGVSAKLAIAVDRLRARRGWPRHVFIRPTERVLGRSAKTRDKDVKPVYIDLESYPFMEIFVHWLAKHKELEVSEMVPTPDELLWREADGRRCFELRTLITSRAD